MHTRPIRTRRRRRVVLAALVAVLALMASACAPPLGRPSIKQVPNGPRVFDNADPAVLLWQGEIYLFGSTNNMKVPVRQIDSFGTPLAESQTDWAQNARDAMPTRPAWVDASEWQIWAPTVIKLGEKFVMFFAAARGGTTSDELNDKCIGRAEATSPMGPYVPQSAPVYCGLPREGAVNGQPPSNYWGRSALDPEVLRGADGKLYMLVAVGRTTANIGALKLDSIGRVIGGVNATPTTLARQSYPWHDGTVDSTRGPGSFLENPSMIYDTNTRTYLLFYSAGRWNTANYVTGFGRCATPAGPCVLDSRAPMLMRGNGRTGVGGLTAFRDAGGTMRVAYATWAQGRENQVGPAGIYKRQTHWMTLRVTATSTTASQAVSLG